MATLRQPARDRLLRRYGFVDTRFARDVLLAGSRIKGWL
jgi:hypothetical protein